MSQAGNVSIMIEKSKNQDCLLKKKKNNEELNFVFFSKPFFIKCQQTTL